MAVVLKPGATIGKVTDGGVRILDAFLHASRAVGRDLTITCGSDNHPPDDPHTRGEAFDLRSSDLTPNELRLALSSLRLVLGDLFTVLYEVPAPPTDGTAGSVNLINPSATAPHIHVQVKKGTAYPPRVL